jgi:hypothetical protein
MFGRPNNPPWGVRRLLGVQHPPLKHVMGVAKMNNKSSAWACRLFSLTKCRFIARCPCLTLLTFPFAYRFRMYLFFRERLYLFFFGTCHSYTVPFILMFDD